MFGKRSAGGAGGAWYPGGTNTEAAKNYENDKNAARKKCLRLWESKTVIFVQKSYKNRNSLFEK